MLRGVLGSIGGGLQLAFIPFRSPDAIVVDTPTNLERDDQSESGWERVRVMFKPTVDSAISPELNMIHQAGFVGMVVGGMWGGFLESRKTMANFIENNQASVFDSHKEAKRKLNAVLGVAFGKGCFRMAWRLALFSSSYVGIVVAVSTYRDRSSMLEYVVGGTVTGSLYKINLGLRGMISGGVFGCLFGSLCGALTMAFFTITGTSIKDMRYYQYKWRQQKDFYIHQAARKQHPEYDDTMYIYPEGVKSDLDTIPDEPVEIDGRTVYEQRPTESVTQPAVAANAQNKHKK